MVNEENKQTREEPTQHYEVRVEDDKVLSVSVEKYPYMATDGYNTTIERKMEIAPDKLMETIESIEEDLLKYPEEIMKVNDTLGKMKVELDVIKESEYWNLVKDNWEEFSKVFGGIQKEQQLFTKETELKNLEIKTKMDEKTLGNYKEVLSKMKENE